MRPVTPPPLSNLKWRVIDCPHITCADPQRAAVDWASHFSREAADRSLPSLRVIISQFQGMPGVIGLHGGLPAPTAFPITSLSFTLRDGTTATIDDPVKVRSKIGVAVKGLQPKLVPRIRLATARTVEFSDASFKIDRWMLCAYLLLTVGVSGLALAT